MRSTSLWREPAVRFATAHGALIAVLVLCSLLRAEHAVALGALAMATTICAVLLPLGYSMALSLAAWGFYTGFVTNSYGELTFTVHDQLRFAVLLTCATAAHWRR